MNSQELIKHVLKVADDKGAEDIVTLSMKDVSVIADYFVICEASNERQVQAIARGVKDESEKIGVTVNRLEGFDQARWILVDLGDVIFHVFHHEERKHYNLERLWGDAPLTQVTLNEDRN